MRCDEFDQTVLALARNKLMDVAARDLSVSHTEKCARCARRLAAELTLISLTRAVVSEIANEEAPARVEAALLAAFDEHRVFAPIAIGRSIGIGRPPAPWKWATIAAAMLVLTSGTATFWFYSNSQRPEREPQATSNAVVKPGPSSLPVAAEAVREKAPGTAERRARSRTPRRRSISPEALTEFYPLTEREDFEALDSLLAVQVVRVELPASALAAAGLSIGPELSNQSVKADVVLGPDGLARAIRFVR